MLEWDILVSMFDALDMESYRVKPEVADRIEVDCNFSAVCESREVNIENRSYCRTCWTACSVSDTTCMRIPVFLLLELT